MAIRAGVCLVLSLLLASPSLQEDAVSPWIPAKDALVTFPATEAEPSTTYVHFLPHEVAPGRRIPAAFIVKTAGEDAAVAYLTGAAGDLGEDLLAKVSEGDKVFLDYMTYNERLVPSWLVSCYERPLQLPQPFDRVHLTGIHLPKSFLSLAELARYPAFGYSYPTGKITIVFVADRSEIVPHQDSEESEEDESAEESD